MYAIKQIKICAEYRDMIHRPRLDLSGTPGLRPIGLSPGSWQTSLGLGGMSRYSAQILICIAYWYVVCMQNTYIHPWVCSILYLLKGLMIIPKVIDPKFNDFPRIALMLTHFKNFSLFLHDLETNLNFNDFSGAVGTLRKLSQNGSTLLSRIIIFN